MEGKKKNVRVFGKEGSRSHGQPPLNGEPRRPPPTNPFAGIISLFAILVALNWQSISMGYRANALSWLGISQRVILSTSF